MDADLDLLLIAVYCTVDDFLPKRPGNARRRITGAEVITLCVAQALLGITSDPRFLAAAQWRLLHLFPYLPERSAFHKRRLRLSPTIEAMIAEFAKHSPGFYDDLLLVDSTPVECARSRETVKRGGQNSLADALANAADYGYCASHSPHFAPIRQRIESIFWTCKDTFTLERYGARTLNSLRVRIATRFAAVAAGIALNYRSTPKPLPRLLHHITPAALLIRPAT